MAPPDHGFHIVLEQHHRTHIRKIRRWRQEIANHAIELRRQDFRKLLSHG